MTAALRTLGALGVAAGLLLVGPLLAGPAIDRTIGFVAIGHSQLVSSSPGAGEVVAIPPTEIRLVFSEPIDGRYTSLDLLDGTGRAILVDAGAPDPADPHVLVAPIPAGTTLATDTLYTVNWRALSAADGHTTDGFLSFGVGNIAVDGHAGGHGSVTDAGTLHSGHSGGAAAAEIQGKVLAYGGSMLAFGLALLAWLVVRPALGRIPRGVAYGSGIALLAGAAGCILLLVVAADSLPASVTATTGGGVDYLAFASSSRVGQLLTARTAVGLVAGIAVLLVARLGGPRGTAIALAIGGLAGLVGLGLTAAGGHASAFASPVPLAMDVVHMAAASVWLGGLVLLGAFTDFGGKSRLEEGALGRIVPRFSALALVSVALIALTGVYADWVQTRDLVGFGTPYELNLLIKIGVFVLALGIGLTNYLDGGRDRGGRFGLSRRVLLELVLGVAVLAITANLTSGSPTGSDQPVAIAPAASSVVSAEPVTLDILPGRPGPNRFLAGLPPSPQQGTVVELVLQRLDQDVGTARVEMRPDFTTPAPTFVADAALAPGSRWDATVVVTAPGGTEVARQRFVFALDNDGIAEGRATPPLDPGLVVALLLLLLGLVGLGYGLAGGTLPRTLPDASRPAVIGASAAGVVLGLAAIILGGPR